MAKGNDPFAQPPEDAPSRLIPSDLDDVLDDPLQAPRKRRLAPFTIVLIGLIIGFGLYSAAAKRADSTVDSMLRLPVGCDTQLTIVKPGSFHVYIETKSSLPPVDGSCANGARQFDNTTMIPQIQMEVTSSSGENQPVYAENGESYSTALYRGVLFGRVRIPQPGTYTVFIRSNTKDAAIALGGDVSESGTSLRYAAYVVAGVAALVALVVRKIPRVAAEDDRYEGI